jgi:hypothetical protein
MRKAPDALQQLLAGFPREGFDGLRHGGERRAQGGAPGHVVDAGERDLLRASKVQVPQGLHAPEGHDVVGGNQRAGPVGAREQRLHDLVGLPGKKAGAADEAGLGHEALVTQGGLVAGAACIGVGQAVGAPNEPDTTVPESHEVFGDHPTCCKTVQADVVASQPHRFAVDHHQGRGCQRLERFDVRRAHAARWPALADLRMQGVIDAVGLGVNDWQVCRDALHEADFDGFLLAGRYTLLDQSALHELLPLCLKREASIVIGGPYNSGVLAPISPVQGGAGTAGTPTYDYRPASPQILERVARLREVAAVFDVELAAAALQFALAHPAVVSVIPGARCAAEVQANLRFAHTPVPAAFWQALKDQRLIDPSAPTPAPLAAGADIGPGDLHSP